MQGPKWPIILLACGPCVVIVNCWDRFFTLGTVTPQKYPRIFIIKFIIYFGYNWANLGIFLGIVR